MIKRGFGVVFNSNQLLLKVRLKGDKLKQCYPTNLPYPIYLLKSFHGISKSDERDFILKNIRLICYKYKHRVNYKTEKKVAIRINQIVHFCHLDSGSSDMIN